MKTPKHAIIFIFLSIFSVPLFAQQQQDTSIVFQYCQLKVSDNSFLGKTKTMEFDFGRLAPLIDKDSKILLPNGRVKRKFESVSDAINFLAYYGWELVNFANLHDSPDPNNNLYYFKKLFKKEDIRQLNIQDN